MHRIRRDTVNERTVRILLECILVYKFVSVAGWEAEKFMRNEDLSFTAVKFRRLVRSDHSRTCFVRPL